MTSAVSIVSLEWKVYKFGYNFFCFRFVHLCIAFVWKVHVQCIYLHILFAACVVC